MKTKLQSNLSMKTKLQSLVMRRLAVGALLLAAPAFSLHADVYSDKVDAFNPDPQYYLRLDETPPTDGQTAVNQGAVLAPDAFYQSIGGSTFATTGPTGGAIPGNAGITTNGWAVRIPDSTLAAGTTPFSFNLFANPTSFAAQDFGTLLGYGAAAGSSMLLTEDGVGGTGRLLFGRLAQNVFTSNGSMTAGQWNAVGLTYNGSDTIKLYLNGILDTTYVDNAIAGFGNQFAVLGAYFGDGSQRFVGGLDEFTYFNGQALSDSQMVDLQIVPEPGTYALLGLSAGAFIFLRRKRSTAQV